MSRTNVALASELEQEKASRLPLNNQVQEGSKELTDARASLAAARSDLEQEKHRPRTMSITNSALSFANEGDDVWIDWVVVTSVSPSGISTSVPHSLDDGLGWKLSKGGTTHSFGSGRSYVLEVQQVGGAKRKVLHGSIPVSGPVVVRVQW